MKASNSRIESPTIELPTIGDRRIYRDRRHRQITFFHPERRRSDRRQTATHAFMWHQQRTR